MRESKGGQERLVGRWSRRDVLRTGAAGLGAYALTDLGPAEGAWAAPVKPGRGGEKNCIFILCVGGPPQHETWDPKPEAPPEIRGPYGAIETVVSGIRISEVLPRLARQADQYAIVRSVHSTAPALHETGCQVMQTGIPSVPGTEWPHYGCVISHLRGSRNGLPAHVVLPRPLGHTVLSLPHGQGAGFLGRAHDPCALSRELLTRPTARAALDLGQEKESLRDRYGRGLFGQNLLRARRLVERGTRFVTVNQFETVFNTPSWDCHGFPDLPTRVIDLRDQVALPFDQAVSALIQDLHDHGLYEDTIVCCFGEFGRTPRITATGGRDHHTGCWSVMLGGGGIRGGQVIGASDKDGALPNERPVTPAMLAATLYLALGISPGTLLPGPGGRSVPLVPPTTPPLRELL
jgi:uncharacterized protein DUF1501